MKEEQTGKVRVLVVDDSALARKILRAGLSQDPGIEVIGPACDPSSAMDLLIRERPDVVTLDVEMPEMDGVSLLRKYMATHPTPTIMVSSMTERGKKITLDALEAGAVDVVAKPKVGVMEGLPVLMNDLCERVKTAARVNLRRYAHPRLAQWPTSARIAAGAGARFVSLQETTDRVIAIGASAGGVAALSHILPLFPAAAPGILIVQHMPAGFTAGFAERLNSLAAVQVREAADGDRIRPGLALLAPGGDRHLQVRRSGGEYRVKLTRGDKVSGHCPSVDVLFHSVAHDVGCNAAAALLTGMGEDGAAGLFAVRQAGGHTFAQDELSSVVFGMPGAAWAMGAAEELVSLDHIPLRLLEALA